MSPHREKRDVTQRITNNIAEFRADRGILDVKGKIIQVESLIDGGFSLNGQGYEKQDLHDIDKSKNIGINVTVYPNTEYKVRDEKGNEKYDEKTGIVLKEHGGVYKVGLNYAETDKTRDVLATIGSNVKINQDIWDVNRDVNRQKGEFEGKEVSSINVDLGTEYWLTKAGRGKAKDIFEEAGRSIEGIKEVLTHRDKVTGEYDFVGNILSESITRRLVDRGFISGKGKKIEQVVKEIEARYGNLTRKGIKVRFYGEGDIDTTKLTKDQLRKLEADGIATTGDGYICINKEKIKDGDTINFNEVISHELTHQILGKDMEYEARYVEGRYGKHLGEIKENGYLKNGKIVDLLMSKLTDEDNARLNRYTDKDMQFKDLSGGEGDRHTVVNLGRQKVETALRQAGKNDRITRIYKKAQERNKGNKDSLVNSQKRIKELKDKNNLTKKETEELIRLTEEIYKEERAIGKLEEKYESIDKVNALNALMCYML